MKTLNENKCFIIYTPESYIIVKGPSLLTEPRAPKKEAPFALASTKYL